MDIKKHVICCNVSAVFFTIKGLFHYLVFLIIVQRANIFNRIFHIPQNRLKQQSPTSFSINYPYQIKLDKVLNKSHGIPNRKSKKWEGQCSLSLTELSNYGNHFTSCSHEVLQRHSGSVLSCSHKNPWSTFFLHLCRSGGKAAQASEVFVLLKKWTLPSCGCSPHTAEMIKICQPASMATQMMIKSRPAKSNKVLENSKIGCIQGLQEVMQASLFPQPESLCRQIRTNR